MPRILTHASRQWQARPDDERFLSLDELEASVSRRKNQSWTATTACLFARADGQRMAVAELFFWGDAA